MLRISSLLEGQDDFELLFMLLVWAHIYEHEFVDLSLSLCLRYVLSSELGVVIETRAKVLPGRDLNS